MDIFESIAGQIAAGVLLISLIGLVTATFVFSVLTRKTLKKSYKELDALLRSRINSEMHNHNTIMALSDSNSKHATLEHKELSKEHTEIRMSIRELGEMLRNQMAESSEYERDITESRMFSGEIGTLSDTVKKQQVRIAQLRKKIDEERSVCEKLNAENREFRNQLTEMKER